MNTAVTLVPGLQGCLNKATDEDLSKCVRVTAGGQWNHIRSAVHPSTPDSLGKGVTTSDDYVEVWVAFMQSFIAIGRDASLENRR